jgi:hypothetical protein
MIHISIPVSIKLDRKNFLTWRSQIEPIVDGYNITKHLDSSASAPPRQIIINNQPIANPEFTTWNMQDHLLLGWLHSTMTGAVLSQHVQCQTAGSLWQALHRVYFAVSSAKIMELCCLFQTTTRGVQGYNDYFE